MGTQQRASRSKLVSVLYKRAKTAQDALLAVSELASSVTDLNQFYPQAHEIVAELMSVPNFYIIFKDFDSHSLKVAYYSDQYEQENNITSSILEYGLTGWVLRNDQYLLCNPDNKQELLANGQITQVGKSAHSWLGVPLVRNGETIGVLAVQSYDSAVTFNHRDAELIQFVATHIVHAIERVQQKQYLQAEIKKQTLELKKANFELTTEITQRQHYENVQDALIEISELSCTSNNIESFYQSVHRILGRLIYAENFFIALLSDDGNTISFPYYVDYFSNKPLPRHFGHGITEYVIRSGEVQLIDHDRLMELSERGELGFDKNKIHHLQSQGFKAWLGAPLVIEDQMKGVIAVQSYQRTQGYKEKDTELIRYVSNHIGLAIDRMLSQQALTRSNEELERIVNARTQALHNVNQDLCLQIEERKKIEERLYHDAHHDALTGLPNRALFTQTLNQTIEVQQRDTGRNYFVLFIDLDRFKIINDTFGHQVGDEFLIQVSKRIGEQITRNDMLARLGGDEFVILLNSSHQLSEAELVAKDIVASLSQPFVIHGNELYAGSSIGLTSSLNNYQSSTEVLRDADAAMYKAKSMGRGRYVVFNESLHQALVDKLALETELRRALKNDEIEFVFQPIIHLENEIILAIEALARWNHPVRGELIPDDFMELAEETGVIFDIDIKALHAAFDLLKQPEFQQSQTLVGVNISGQIIYNNSQLKAVKELILSSGINPQQLILEFSENTLADHVQATAIFECLSELGVKIALDDLGAGSGSMNLLFSAPIDYVKVDRQVVDKLEHCNKMQDFVEVVCQIGEKVGFTTIAEGVETKQQRSELDRFGCLFGQGQYFQSAAELAQKLVKSEDYDFNIARKLAI